MSLLIATVLVLSEAVLVLVIEASKGNVDYGPIDDAGPVFDYEHRFAEHEHGKRVSLR